MARTKHGWQRARSNSNFELLDNSAPIPQSEVITTYSSRDNDRLYFTEDNDYSAIRAASVSAPASPRLSPPTLRHPQRRGWWSSNGWSWEISAAALSLMCLAAVIAILASMNNRQLGDWKLPISVNALLSVFLTVAKTSLLVPITVCISQLKWPYYEQRSRNLFHLQPFDEASRGPWGAIRFLFFTRGAARLASLGAVLTIAALAMDPFAQQIIEFGSRFDSLSNITASLPIAQAYMRSEVYTGRLDADMFGAIQAGIYGINQPLNAKCATGNCAFPSFQTLGVCSKCQNVTATTTRDCRRPSQRATLSCVFDTGTGKIIDVPPSADSRAGLHNPNATYTYMHFVTNISSSYNETFAGVKFPLFGFTGVKLFHPGNSPSTPVYFNPGPTFRYETSECAFFMCIQTFPNATVKDGITHATPDPALETQLYRTPWTNKGDTLAYFSTNQSDATLEAKKEAEGPQHYGDPKPPSYRNFQYATSWTYDIDLADALEKTFNLSGVGFLGDHESPIAIPIYEAADIADVMRNVSASMTDVIRKRGASLNTSQNPAEIASHSGMMVEGKVLGITTTIGVRWEWLIFPALVIVGGVLFLILTIIHSARDHSLLWKDSTLALLLHGVDIEEEGVREKMERWHLDPQASVDEMNIWAKHYSVKLHQGSNAENGQGGRGVFKVTDINEKGPSDDIPMIRTTMYHDPEDPMGSLRRP